MQSYTEYEEKTISIGSVKSLLEQGYEIDVTSPDGWVPVDDYVEKGMFDEYHLHCNGKDIYCNADHLFETPVGWLSAKEIHHFQDARARDLHFLCEDGKFAAGHISMTGKEVEIVDIHVNHKNHRYYTDGISSHNTGGGKSLMMCHMASAALAQGRNVLYITCEMAEERIAERIDANLFDIPLDDLVNVSKEVFTSKINRIKGASAGKLIIKEYPTGIAHVGHFRALLNDLKLKKGFMPDIIYVDYLNICASSRMKGLGGAINSYSLVKAIAEEVRGLAVEFNVPIWSATQTNRDGFDNSDADLTNVAESFGLPATADFMIVIINTEELAANNRIMIKQLKNRYRDVNVDKRFLLGSDRPYMRLYDVDNATDGLMKDTASPAAATGGSKSASKKMDTSDFKM